MLQVGDKVYTININQGGIQECEIENIIVSINGKNIFIVIKGLGAFPLEQFNKWYKKNKEELINNG